MSYQSKFSNIWVPYEFMMVISIVGTITAGANILVVASLMGVGSLLGYCLYKDCYKRLCDADKERSKYRLENDIYKRNYETLKQEYIKLLTSQKSSNNSYSDDVFSALKYAMQMSHPDNGGKTEDFIKFKKLYDSMKA